MSVQEHSLREKQSTMDNIPSPPASDNEHDFSLTDLLQPTMTLEQIKIIEMALAKIKSKRDALLLNEQEGITNALTRPSLTPNIEWDGLIKKLFCITQQ
jgi:hypothetical protein